MRILIVEDDYHQADAISASLAQRFQQLVAEKIKTELGFRKQFGQIVENPPDIILLDIMLRWTDPSPDIELPPDEIKNEGFFRAGLRCMRMLKGNPRTETVPIILYSILDRSDLDLELSELPSNVFHLPKESDSTRLINKISDLIRQRHGRS